MKTKHTKGPWNIEYHEPLDTFRVKNSDESVAIICGTKQDAALIAAAPEMFEVLQLIGTIANVGIETDSDYKNRMKRISEHATEILKKARGE